MYSKKIFNAMLNVVPNCNTKNEFINKVNVMYAIMHIESQQIISSLKGARNKYNFSHLHKNKYF